MCIVLHEKFYAPDTMVPLGDTKGIITHSWTTDDSHRGAEGHFPSAEAKKRMLAGKKFTKDE